MAAIMYFSSCAVVIPVNITEDTITPAKIATPGKFGGPMTPEEVVNISLDSYKNNDVIVITGDHNIDEVIEWKEINYKKHGRFFSKNFTKSGLFKEL